MNKPVVLFLIAASAILLTLVTVFSFAEKPANIYVSSRFNDGIVDFVESIESKNIKLQIRSSGGDVASASKVSAYIYDKSAQVIVQGYCLSACAEFVLPSADKLVFLDEPIIAFHWSPIMDFNQYKLRGKSSVCKFDNLDSQLSLLKKRGLDQEFWRVVEDKLELVEFKFVDYGESCPWKFREFKNVFWLPTSEQLRGIWGLRFEGGVCADDMRKCRIKIDNYWKKGTRVAVGDDVYISKGTG